MLTDTLAHNVNDPDLKKSINRVQKFDVGDIIKGIIDRNDKTKEYGIIWNSRRDSGRTTAVKQLLGENMGKIKKKDTVYKYDLTNMEFSIRLDIARARDDMHKIKKLIEQILYILDTK